MKETNVALLRTTDFELAGFIQELTLGSCLATVARELRPEHLSLPRASASCRSPGKSPAVARGPYILAQLAEVYGKSGEEDEGLVLLAEALSHVERTGERWYEAELHRLKGVLLLQQAEHRGRNAEREATKKRRTAAPAASSRRQRPLDQSAAADACFRTAIEVAQRQQAKSLELRAIMSLSRLWQQQRKRHQAHEMLGEIYGWFTEGFDTADLRDAQALLAELA